MDIEIKYYAMLRDITGKKIETISISKGSTVKNLLDLLTDKYGSNLSKYLYDDQDRLRKYFTYLVNKVNIKNINGFDTILEEGDEFIFMPPIGGG